MPASCSASASRSGRPCSSPSSASSCRSLLCGIIAIAGKRGSAPTMVLSRAAFGVTGQKVPGVISWLTSIGWETFLAIIGDAGHGHDLRAARLGRRHRHQGRRVPRRRRAHRARVGRRLPHHHAAAVVPDVDHRASRPIVYVALTVERRRLGRGQRHPGRVDTGRDRRPRPGDDRLRPRLDQHRRRLVALPAPRRLGRLHRRRGTPSAARSPRSCSSSTACCSPARTTSSRSGIQRRPDRHPRARSCRRGSSCRSSSPPSSPWSAAPCSASTPPA